MGDEKTGRGTSEASIPGVALSAADEWQAWQARAERAEAALNDALCRVERLAIRVGETEAERDAALAEVARLKGAISEYQAVLSVVCSTRSRSAALAEVARLRDDNEEMRTALAHFEREDAARDPCPCCE